MLNNVVLIGRLASDPDLRYTPNGVATCTFRLAVDRERKNQQGEREADFLPIVAWKQSAEFCANYLSKGRLVAVTGRIQTRNWVGQDGQKHYATEIIAHSLKALDKPKEGEGAYQQPPSDTGYEGVEAAAFDDPFADE